MSAQIFQRQCPRHHTELVFRPDGHGLEVPWCPGPHSHKTAGWLVVDGENRVVAAATLDPIKDKEDPKKLEWVELYFQIEMPEDESRVLAKPRSSMLGGYGQLLQEKTA